MDTIRQELRGFAIASEHLLAHDVRLAELNATEMEMINYYLLAIAKKFSPEDSPDDSSEHLQETIGTA